MSAHIDNAATFKLAMEPVARAILGDPNSRLSTKTNLRFGTNGSLSVDLENGLYFDNEINDGGGVLKFVQIRKDLDKDDAVKWLQDNKYIEKSESSARLVAAYDYHDANGRLVFQVVRYEPKKFVQRQPDGKGGWIWKMQGVTRVIYRLPQVVQAIAAGKTIYIAEGEKGVANLESVGLVGTCSPGGAGKWRTQYNAVFAGADVVILPDNDPQADKEGTPLFHPDGRPKHTGQDHADDVARNLHGVAKRVRWLMLPGLPPKGDVADWIAAGGTAATLTQLADATPDWDGTFHGSDRKAEPQPTAADDDDVHPSSGRGFSAVPPERDPVEEVIAELNADYMVVSEAGKAMIYKPAFDPVLRHHRYDRYTFEDFKRLYLNRTVRVSKDGEDPVYKCIADVWVRSPNRRQFINGIVFDPTEQQAPGTLNLWQGYAVQARPGDWSLLKHHIWTVICKKNETNYRYVMGWMARLTQKPAEQGHTAIVMRGGEGTGKGIVARALLRIVGQHGIAISNAKHLVGNFNAHLRDVVLLFADEAFFAGDKAHVGVLKSIITEPYLAIEAKYQNTVQAPNCLHLIMASNEDWVVPASKDARRFCVFDVSEERKGDHQYFQAIAEQLESGGYEAMLYDLQQLDISKFNVRNVPDTDGLAEQKKLTLQVPEAWWLDCLHRGYIFKSRLGLDNELCHWFDKLSTELLYESYQAFAERKRDRHPLSRESFGRFMVSMKAKPKRLENAAVGEHITDVDNGFGSTIRKAVVRKHPRPPGYQLGNLDTARAGFLASTGILIDWQDPPDQNDVRVGT